MYYVITYPEKTTGGSGGSKGGGTSGSSGGSKGGSTGGKNGTGGTTSGGSSASGGTGGGGGVKIKKSSDLAKMPPTTVHQPDGTAIVMNMQDFCYLPNANALNAVAFQQCISRKKHDDDSVPMWLVIVVIAFFIVMIVSIIGWALRD